MSGELCILINGGILGMLGQGLRLAGMHYRWVMKRNNDVYFWKYCFPITSLIISFLVGYITLHYINNSISYPHTLITLITIGYFSPYPLIITLRYFRKRKNRTPINLT